MIEEIEESNFSCDNTKNYNQLVYRYEQLKSFCEQQDNYISNLESENLTLLKSKKSVTYIASQIKKECINEIEERMILLNESMRQYNDELKLKFKELEKKLLTIDKRIDEISKEIIFNGQADNYNQIVKIINSNKKFKDKLNHYEKIQATMVLEIEEIKDIIKFEAEDIVCNSNQNKMLLEEIKELKEFIQNLNSFKHFYANEKEEELAKTLSRSYISLDELDSINEAFTLKENTSKLKVKLFYIIFIFIIFYIIRYVIYFHGQILTVKRIQEQSIV